MLTSSSPKLLHRPFLPSNHSHSPISLDLHKVSSSTGLDWNKTLLQSQNLELPKPFPPSMKKQQQHQQSQQPAEPLKCPRCDSTNTKFCYYNNYNKSQPRHFCRACKRHWTKGGTLRNVPVGGGRKNKRAKKSTTTTTSNGNITVPPLALNDQKSMASTLYQSMIRPPPLLPQQNLMSVRDSEAKDFGGVGGGGMFVSSPMNLPQSQGLVFPFSTSSSFDANPCSVSASNVYSYGEEFKTMEEPKPEPEATMSTSIMPNTSGGANTQLWEIPATSTAMEMSNYWGWEDLDSLVSTDLNIPWDDSDIKP